MAKPCVALCSQNGSKVKVLRCKDFGVEESFGKSYGHFLLPKIAFLALASTTRLKGKGVTSTNANSDSLHNMKHTDGVGDYADAFSPVPAAAVSALFSVLPPNSTCFLVMSIFLRPLYKVNYYLRTITIETCIFHLHRVTKRILDTFIVSSSHCVACRQPPVRGIQP